MTQFTATQTSALTNTFLSNTILDNMVNSVEDLNTLSNHTAWSADQKLVKAAHLVKVQTCFQDNHQESIRCLAQTLWGDITELEKELERQKKQTTCTMKELLRACGIEEFFEVTCPNYHDRLNMTTTPSEDITFSTLTHIRHMPQQQPTPRELNNEKNRYKDDLEDWTHIEGELQYPPSQHDTITISDDEEDVSTKPNQTKYQGDTRRARRSSGPLPPLKRNVRFEDRLPRPRSASPYIPSPAVRQPRPRNTRRTRRGHHSTSPHIGGGCYRCHGPHTLKNCPRFRCGYCGWKAPGHFPQQCDYYVHQHRRGANRLEGGW
jgi:hypothetical protein